LLQAKAEVALELQLLSSAILIIIKITFARSLAKARGTKVARLEFFVFFFLIIIKITFARSLAKARGTRFNG
jgi:hypothetical protein